jgi:hypothetical protein
VLLTNEDNEYVATYVEKFLALRATLSFGVLETAFSLDAVHPVIKPKAKIKSNPFFILISFKYLAFIL